MKKIILLVFCLIFISVFSIYTTFAFLTDTEETNNTYTVGDVDIILDESNVDRLGVLLDDTRVKENSYHLMPGYTYLKDPMITVLNNSEDCYVRMFVTIDNISNLKQIYGDDFVLEDMYSEWGENWVYSDIIVESNDVYTYEYRYKMVVNGDDGDNELEPLFKKFSIPGETTLEQLEKIENLKINIVGQAIQSNGFEDADMAWKMFNVE